MRGRGVAERPETRALLLARVVFGESDLVVTLLSWADGKVSALAKGARKSQKRFGGALEPFQTLSVALEERRGDLWSLQRAEVQRPRVRLLGRLEAVTAAGEALRWTRHLLPVHARRAARPRWTCAAAAWCARPAEEGRGSSRARSAPPQRRG